MFVIVKQESFATVSVGILKLLLPVLLLAFRGRGIKHSKWIFYFFLGGMFRTFFLLLLWVFCFRVERFLRWLCVASAVPLKLAKNVFLTDASSYLPRTVVGFKPRGGGHLPRDPLKHMLLVLSPSAMTEPRPMSMRSSLMAGKVKGHIWARMDFFHSCTQTFARAHDK